MSRWDSGKLAGVDAVWRGLICNIGQVDASWLLLSSDESVPRIATLTDDLLGVLLVLAFTAESELILRLSVWDLVDTEPLVGGPEKARQVTLDIFNVIQLGSQWVVDL